MFYYNSIVSYVIETINTVFSMEDCISKRTIANFLNRLSNKDVSLCR